MMTFQKICATHLLLIIVQEVIRVQSRKCPSNVTHLLQVIGQYVTYKTSFQKMVCSVSYMLLGITQCERQQKFTPLTLC